MVPEVAKGCYEGGHVKSDCAPERTDCTLLEPIFRGSCTHIPWMAHAMEAKLTISQVNRRWHLVVQPLLHAEAPLHCSVQVHLFADVLRGNPGFRRLLRKLVFHCFASTVAERDSLISDLVFILT